MLQKAKRGTSLMPQWLRFCASDAGHVGSISGQGSVPHAMWHGPPKENKNKQNQQKWIKSEEVSEGGCRTLREGASLEEGGGLERKALPEGQSGHVCLAPLRARL